MITDGLTPAAVLAMLGTAACAGLLVVVSAGAAATHHGRIALAALGALALGVGAYAVVLASVSLASQERVLAAGQEKHICSMDCHIAYSVESVKHSDPGPLVATVKVRFDPETIAPWRGDSPLTPSITRVCVEWIRAPGCTPPREGARPFNQPLRPGQSVTADLTFDVPAGAARPRLFVFDDFALDRLVIGHERSPGHADTVFDLGS